MGIKYACGGIFTTNEIHLHSIETQNFNVAYVCAVLHFTSYISMIETFTLLYTHFGNEKIRKIYRCVISYTWTVLAYLMFLSIVFSLILSLFLPSFIHSFTLAMSTCDISIELSAILYTDTHKF